MLPRCVVIPIVFPDLGFAGSDDKVKYLKEIGFDAAYNYKTIQSLDATLKEACPKGIDMFFDNASAREFVSLIIITGTICISNT